MSRLYLRHAVWDFILTAIAAIALCYMLLDGFYIDPNLQYSVIPAVIIIVCLVALFIIAQNRRMMLIGGIIYGVVLIVVWAVCAVLTPNGAVFEDFEENYLIFAMIVTLTATGCFVLSRVQFGVAVLFIVGAFLIGLIQLFYDRFELLWTILFVMSALALIIYRNYQHSVRTSMGIERTSFMPGFLVSIVACAVAVGLAAGVWYGIIGPLNPDAVDIKLITEYRALETKEVRGISDEYQTPNLDMTSDVTNDDSRTTDDIKEDLNGLPWPATGETDEEPEEDQQNNSLFGMNLDSVQEAFDLQSNPQNWPLIVILLLIIALIVLYFILRRVRRKTRLNKFREQNPDQEFESIFLSLLERLKRVGVTVPNGQTMLEFGESSKAVMRFYDDESGVAFKDLTDCYSTMAYGKQDASAEDVSKIETFYSKFWKGARKQLGNIKYFFKSFRL